MKLFFYVITQHQSRTGEPIGKTCGVLYAENEEEAREKVFAEVGNDSASFQFAEEIDPEKGFHFTVYKSM